MVCCLLTSRALNRSAWLRRSQSVMMNNGNRAELDHVGIVEESRNMNNVIPTSQPNISPEALAHLGDGQIAYIRTIRSEDVPAMFPQASAIAPGLQLFALLAADGTPIMATDSREAAIANAWSNELQTLSVH